MISEYVAPETDSLDGQAPGAPSFVRVFGQRKIDMIARRTFIKRASMLAIAATASAIGRESRGQQVSNSAGPQAPEVRASEGSCDCHMHNFDPARLAMPPSPRAAPSNA